MKAFVVPKYKRPLELADVPEPTVGPEDVLVDVCAAGVNPIDARLRDGKFKIFLPYKAPFGLGHDVSGTVREVGNEVTAFVVGDEVYGRPRDGRIGTFAERISVHQDDLAPKPKGISLVEAAAVPLVALTAWQALVEVASVQPGQKVLVQAGSGGVGTYAIQLAKHLGAHVATTTGTSNVDWVRGLGADVVVDYRTTDFEAELSGYDVVLDSQGDQTLAKSLRVLGPGGLAMGIAGPPDAAFAKLLGLPLPVRAIMALLSFSSRRAAKARGARYSFLYMHASGANLREISKLIEDKTLTPIIDRTFPFDETPQALAYVESGRVKGKVVVTLP